MKSVVDSICDKSVIQYSHAHPFSTWIFIEIWKYALEWGCCRISKVSGYILDYKVWSIDFYETFTLVEKVKRYENLAIFALDVVRVKIYCKE